MNPDLDLSSKAATVVRPSQMHSFQMYLRLAADISHAYLCLGEVCLQLLKYAEVADWKGDLFSIWNVVDIVVLLGIAAVQIQLSSYDCGESAKSLIRNQGRRPYHISPLCVDGARHCSGQVISLRWISRP
jgi:hypothetical protein